jgi:hypothetical protein
LLLWLIEIEVFQMSQLHKYFNVGGKSPDSVDSDAQKSIKFGKKEILQVQFWTGFPLFDIIIIESGQTSKFEILSADTKNLKLRRVA